MCVFYVIHLINNFMKYLEPMDIAEIFIHIYCNATRILSHVVFEIFWVFIGETKFILLQLYHTPYSASFILSIIG